MRIIALTTRQRSRHDTDAAPVIPEMSEEKGQDQCAFEQVPPREIGRVLEGSSPETAMQHRERGLEVGGGTTSRAASPHDVTRTDIYLGKRVHGGA